MFHGPVMYMAKVPRANSWYRLATSVLLTGGASPSRYRDTRNANARMKLESANAP